MKDEEKRVKLTKADSPAEKAPKYPGRWSRNNKNGSEITKEEYLQQKTDEWYEHVRKKPAYSSTAMGNKALSLYVHLRESYSNRKRSKIDQDECRRLLENTEAKVRKMEETEETEEGEAPEQERVEEEMEEGDREQQVEVVVAGDGGVVERDSIEMEENDQEWTPRKGRDRTEKMVNELLKKPKEELFQGVEESMNSPLERSYKIKERKEEYSREVCAQKTDMELFGPDSDISLSVTESKAFKERAEQLAETFCQNKEEAEILRALPDSPEEVRQSKFVKDRLSLLTKKEKSEKVVMESVRETMDKLKLNKSPASREQQLVIAAAVTSSEYGVPGLGLNQKDEKEVNEMKAKLMQEEEKILKKPEKAVRQVFPRGVVEVAEQHWESITTTEPGKHRRHTKAVKDGDETVPTRYQTMTNEEAYQSFHESCADDIKVLMEEHGQSMEAVVAQRPESSDKQYRLQLARERVPGKFPSLSWFISKRPREVKPMDDHTTGLCKVRGQY